MAGHPAVVSRVYRDGHETEVRRVPKIVEGVCEACGGALPEARILLHDRGIYSVLAVKRVNGLVSNEKYTELFTASGSAGFSQLSIADLMRLYPNDWVRIHRGAAIRLSAFQGARRERGSSRELVSVEGCPPLALSRRQRAVFHRMLKRTLPFDAKWLAA